MRLVRAALKSVAVELFILFRLLIYEILLDLSDAMPTALRLRQKQTEHTSTEPVLQEFLRLEGAAFADVAPHI